MKEGLKITTEEDINPIILAEKELSLEEKMGILEIENKKLQIENKEQKNKIEMRDKLFRVIAHDLRNPIGNTAVITEIFLEDLKTGLMSNEELYENLNAVVKNNESIMVLLNDLLTWSKLQIDGIKPESLIINLLKFNSWNLFLTL